MFFFLLISTFINDIDIEPLIILIPPRRSKKRSRWKMSHSTL